jgi:hypothetical protein
LVITLCGVGCGGEEIDRSGARDLRERIQADEYETWDRAPGYESPQPSLRAHGDTAIVFVNEVVTSALLEQGLSAWPEGSLIVKESFTGGEFALLAAMEKQAGEWFYAEWDDGGQVKYGGRPDICVDCHQAGNDEVLAVSLP